jgi:type I restriction enzyme, S subunit
MPNLNTKILGDLPLVAVPSVLQTAYDHVIGPTLDRRNHNWAENDTLAELRDLLLPKLISGELRVAVAEKMVEAVL